MMTDRFQPPRYPAPTVPAPDRRELQRQLEAAVMEIQTHFPTTDGCEVEPDGTCEHGHPTWLRKTGLI